MTDPIAYFDLVHAFSSFELPFCTLFTCGKWKETKYCTTVIGGCQENGRSQKQPQPCHQYPFDLVLWRDMGNSKVFCMSRGDNLEENIIYNSLA